MQQIHMPIYFLYRSVSHTSNTAHREVEIMRIAKSTADAMVSILQGDRTMAKRRRSRVFPVLEV